MTGSTAANELARNADLVVAVGTRLSDFTTGSHSLFAQARLVAINVNAFDALKWRAAVVLGDAAAALDGLSTRLGGWTATAAWQEKAVREAEAWRATVSGIVGVREVAPPKLPYDGEVIGAVQRSHPQSAAHDIVVCAAGTLPAELHKLWRALRPGGYHMEYGYSCMGYEIAGGIGVKMAHPRARDRRDGRRWQLPDAELGDRDLGDARHEARHRRSGQPWLWLHPPAAAGRWRRGLQQSVRRLRAGFARNAGDRLRSARALARRAGRARGIDRRARGGARPGASGRSHVRRGHRHRSLAHDRGGRLVVGGRGS